MLSSLFSGLPPLLFQLLLYRLLFCADLLLHAKMSAVSESGDSDDVTSGRSSVIAHVIAHDDSRDSTVQFF